MDLTTQIDTSARPAGGSAKVSLCMIVKDEERNLPQCIGPVADLVDEIIVVDTGSSDGTKQVAAGLGARVFDFAWVDSFAAARNESKRHARGDWIFWLDADDRLDDTNRAKLRSLFAGLKPELAAYVFRVDVLPSSPADPVRVVDHARLFRNHPKVGWHYRVHEQVLPTVCALKGRVYRTDVVIQHVGYQDASLKPQKLERNLRLMRLDERDKPNDPFVLYNIGRALERKDQIAEAIPYWMRSLTHAPAKETYVRKLYSLLSQGHSRLGRRAESLQACLGGLARFPDDPELLFLSGSYLHEAGDYAAAESCLNRLLELPPARHLALGDDPGISTHKARNLLARVYHDQRSFAKAEPIWRAILSAEPQFLPAWLGLGQTLVERRDWNGLDEALRRLAAMPEAAIVVAVLRGLRHAVDKDYDAARQLMEQTVAQHPKSLEPRVLLSRLCMRERHKDPAAAERAVRGVLELDPGNVEAQRQLLKLQQSPAAELAAPPAAP